MEAPVIGQGCESIKSGRLSPTLAKRAMATPAGGHEGGRRFRGGLFGHLAATHHVGVGGDLPRRVGRYVTGFNPVTGKDPPGGRAAASCAVGL